MRFLVDAQLPPALARWIGEQGFSAQAVREVGLKDSDDGSIWNFAVAGNWTVITKDEDFVARCISSENAPQLLWLRIGNCTNSALVRWLEPFWPEIMQRLQNGEKLIEVR